MSLNYAKAQEIRIFPTRVMWISGNMKKEVLKWKNKIGKPR